MTTAPAHNATADLRRDLTEELDKRRAALAAMLRSTRHSMYRVLYADCGMVIIEAGGVFRLGSIANHREFIVSTAQAAADRWNAALTREQMASRCWVNVLTVPQAYERAIEELEAVLDVLAKPEA